MILTMSLALAACGNKDNKETEESLGPIDTSNNETEESNKPSVDVDEETTQEIIDDADADWELNLVQYGSEYDVTVTVDGVELSFGKTYEEMKDAIDAAGWTGDFPKAGDTSKFVNGYVQTPSGEFKLKWEINDREYMISTITFLSEKEEPYMNWNFNGLNSSKFDHDKIAEVYEEIPLEKLTNPTWKFQITEYVTMQYEERIHKNDDYSEETFYDVSISRDPFFKR